MLLSPTWATIGSVMFAASAEARASSTVAVVLGTVNSEPPLNSMPRLRPRPKSADQGEQQDHARDGVPATALADEVVGDLAAVEPVREGTEAGHQDSFVAGAAGRWCVSTSTRAGLTPRRSGDRPVQWLPEVNHDVRMSSDTSGRVNRNATATSTTVVSPSVKANPRTLPTDRKYRTTAARTDTKSAARIVRRARIQPASPAARRLRPSRISSLMRSK